VCGSKIERLALGENHGRVPLPSVRSVDVELHEIPVRIVEVDAA
jgi:hypothetical protein